MVKAKFFIRSVEVYSAITDGAVSSGSVNMSPVCRGAVNKQWAQATPSGQIQMHVNGPAAQWFAERIGTELSITFDEAGNDPATHPFEALDPEFQPTEAMVKSGYRPDDTCVQCGHPRQAHSD